MCACVLTYCQQEDHASCHKDSFCHSATYKLARIILKDAQAIEVYEKLLQSTTVYKYAESYCRVCHMYESCPVTVMCFVVQRYILGGIV